MSKILKNNTGSPVSINDVGQTVPASSQLTIQPQDYLLYAASDDVITLIGAATLTVNDGSNDLSISDGSKLIQGIFPNPIGINGSDGTQIGNVGDALKTNTVISPDADSSTYDSFGRLRVSQPDVVFDVRFINDLAPLIVTTTTSMSGTVTRNAATSSADLNVTLVSGSRSLLQSKEYIQYIPGRTAQAYFAARFSANSANRKQRLGTFSDNDGLFFEYDNGVLYSVTRTSVSGSPVDTRVAQSSWNIDPMDGTGPSGITLNPENIQTYVIQYQWHGAGVRVWGLSINNRIIYTHKELSGTVTTNPWAKTGDFPLRGEVINTALAANSATLRIQSFVALNEGSSFTAVQSHAVSRNTDVSLNNSTFRPALSLRLKSSYNRAILEVDKIVAVSTSSDDLEVKIIINPTLVGASWVSAGTNSIAEYDVSSSSQSGGDVIGLFYIAGRTVSGNPTSDTLLKVLANYSGTSDILSITIRSVDNAAKARVGVTFKEKF